MAITYQADNPSVFINPDIRLKRTSWEDDMDARFESLIAAGKPFSADDIHGIVPMNERNTIGNTFRALAKAGRINRIGDLRSNSTTRKGGRIGLWINANRIT